jgi:hypothetical protein
MTLKGRYSDAAPSFDFFDDDGFLTLTMVLNVWQANGTTAKNLTQSVEVDRRDLLLLRDAAAVGRGFFNSIVVYGAKKMDLTPDQLAEIDDAKSHLALWEKIDLQIGRSLAAEQGDTTSLPVKFINGVGEYLERLRPLAARRIESRYRDFAADGTISQLCTAEAANPMVGRILCDRDFRTGVRKSDAYCSAESVVRSPATAVICDATIANNKLSATRCTNGAGGPAASLPATD